MRNGLCCVTRYDEVVSADEIRVTGDGLSRSVGIMRLDRRVPLVGLPRLASDVEAVIDVGNVENLVAQITFSHPRPVSMA
jgi:hypothetical protein